MIILVVAFILGMMILMAAAEDLPMDEEAERRWIDYLADSSKRRFRKNRGRYSKSGVQK